MREVPKVLHTTLILKSIRGTGLIALPNGKKCKNVTMDNPQTVPKLVIVRVWNMSQRLPGKWMNHLTNDNDSRRYSLFRTIYMVVKNILKRTVEKSSRIIKGVLSEADIISAEPIMEMTNDNLKRIVGNGFFSNLGSMLSKAVDIYSKTKPAVSAIKGMLPEGSVKKALGAVGYGMAGAGPMAGAGVVSGAAMKMRGKKSLSDRLM